MNQETLVKTYFAFSFKCILLVCIHYMYISTRIVGYVLDGVMNCEKVVGALLARCCH